MDRMDGWIDRWSTIVPVKSQLKSFLCVASRYQSRFLFTILEEAASENT